MPRLSSRYRAASRKRAGAQSGGRVQMMSARARFIGTYVVNLRAVPLRAFTDLRLDDVVERLARCVLGEQPLHREAPCRSHRPTRISSVVVEDADPGVH